MAGESGAGCIFFEKLRRGVRGEMEKVRGAAGEGISYDCSVRKSCWSEMEENNIESAFCGSTVKAESESEFRRKPGEEQKSGVLSGAMADDKERRNYSGISIEQVLGPQTSQISPSKSRQADLASCGCVREILSEVGDCMIELRWISNKGRWASQDHAVSTSSGVVPPTLCRRTSIQNERRKLVATNFRRSRAGVSTARSYQTCRQRVSTLLHDSPSQPYSI